MSEFDAPAQTARLWLELAALYPDYPAGRANAALWLYQEYRSAVPVSIYVGASCALSGIAALLARETKGVELRAIR